MELRSEGTQGNISLVLLALWILTVTAFLYCLVQSGWANLQG